MTPWKQNLAAEAQEKLSQRTVLADHIAKQSLELGSLDEWLTHAKALLGPDFPGVSQVSQPRHIVTLAPDEQKEDEDSSHADVIGAAIDEVLKRVPQGLKTSKLRAEVLKNAEAARRIEERLNRFYSVLNRRVNNGKLVRKGKFYRLATPVSPQGETGAVAAPASH